MRLPMVYGPDDEGHRLTPYVKRHVGQAAGNCAADEGMARWRCLRGYVQDMAAAVVLAVTNPGAAGRVYNVAEPIAYTEAEWVARIWGSCRLEREIVAAGGEDPCSLQHCPGSHVKTLLDLFSLATEKGLSLTTHFERRFKWKPASPAARAG